MVNNRTHFYCQYLSVYTEKFLSPLLAVCMCVLHAAHCSYYPSTEKKRGGGVTKTQKFDVGDDERERDRGRRKMKGQRREEMIMQFKIMLALKRGEWELQGGKERRKQPR